MSYFSLFETAETGILKLLREKRLLDILFWEKGQDKQEVMKPVLWRAEPELETETETENQEG